jgi:L-ascorbate metabolism protein UlaG (beta-lactamase superfamily)
MKSIMIMILFSTFNAFAADQFESDVIKTTSGDLKITFIGHASLFLTFGGYNIYIDPYSKLADYSKMPKADLILITHDHGDHLDKTALGLIMTPKTDLIITDAGSNMLGEGTVMKNGDVKTIKGIMIEAVPAYNIVNKRNGVAYHPKGTGNGYVLTFGDKRIYIAGDTENIPEMKDLKNIYCAFLPMNLPYTMTPEMVYDAAMMIKPAVLYPYHFGETDTSKIVELLKNSGIDVRIRKMK